MTNGIFEAQKSKLEQTSMGTFLRLKITSDVPHSIITDDVGTTYDFEYTNNQEGEYLHVNDMLSEIPSGSSYAAEEQGGDGVAGDFNNAVPADETQIPYDWRN